MQPITQYQTKEEYIRLLLQGPPGSAKTTTACQFPSAYFIDIDVNLGGPLRFCKQENLTLPIGYDRVDIDENGKEVPLPQRWNRIEKLVASTPPEAKTVIFDSATGLTDILMAHVKMMNPSLKDGRQVYMFYLEAGKQFLTKFTLLKKNIVLTAHEKIEKDEMTGITQYRVAWPGQLGDYVGAFFTNVWRTEVLREGFGPTAKYQYVIRTMQDAQNYGLKNDLGLPPLFEFKWDLIASKLNI